MSAELAPLVLGLAVTVLLWDIVLAGWITSRKGAPMTFVRLTGLCGLLVAPALVVALATGTEAGSRTVSVIAWLLPAISAAFVLQVLYAIIAGLVSPVTALPILLYDIAVATVAVGDYLVTQRGGAPDALQAAVAARDALFGMAVGRAAMVSPFALLVPMIAPAYPARWRLSAVVRALLVLAATTLTTLLVLEWPRGLGAVQSYRRAFTAPVQRRPAGDLAIGLRLLPALRGAPQARLTASDLALVRQIGPDIVLLLLDVDAAGAVPLDSIARVLDPLRDQNLRIAVALTLDGPPSHLDDLHRLDALERVLARLKPEVVFPALSPPIPDFASSTPPSAAWWRAIETRSAAVVERVRPRAQLGWAAARLDATDSAVYAWAARSPAIVRLLGAVSYPSFSGLPAVNARLHAFERWQQAANALDAGAQPHWLVNVGGLPRAHGDAAQLAAIRQAVSWSSRRPWIKAVIIGEPTDYEGGLGLRAANGRLRSAVRGVAALADSLRVMR